MVSISLDALPSSLPWVIEQIKLGNKVSIFDEKHEFAVLSPADGSKSFKNDPELAKKQREALKKLAKEGKARLSTGKLEPCTLNVNLSHASLSDAVMEEREEAWTRW